jgi:hypothetical protein
MSYLIRLVPELRAWLADLCAIDPAAAELAGPAITVLLTDGDRAGPPLIVPAGPAAPLDRATPLMTATSGCSAS